MTLPRFVGITDHTLMQLVVVVDRVRVAVVQAEIVIRPDGGHALREGTFVLPQMRHIHSTRFPCVWQTAYSLSRLVISIDTEPRENTVRPTHARQ